MKLSFIGPGTMGYGMAMNLARSEKDCLVIGRSPEKLRPFSEAGFSVSDNTARGAESELVFLCLPDYEALSALLFGAASPLGASGQIVVDCTTLDYRRARELAERLSARGIDYLDAPISGHRARALEGSLSIMCGGDKGAFEKAAPYLSLMGEALYLGASGAGQLAKMINNCVLNICAASFCELMPLGVSMGLDPEKLGHILTTASGASYASKSLIPKILEGDFHHDFTLAAAHKDVASLEALLEEKGLHLPTFSGMKESYERALSEGFGHWYKGAMILPYEQDLGVSCRKGEADA